MTFLSADNENEFSRSRGNFFLISFIDIDTHKNLQRRPECSIK